MIFEYPTHKKCVTLSMLDIVLKLLYFYSKMDHPDPAEVKRLFSVTHQATLKAYLVSMEITVNESKISRPL